MIADLYPDRVRIDRGFVEGIRSHSRKRILVESLVSLCHRINCSVVAEGVESAEDLETCLSAGVAYLQGFLLARPMSAEAAFFVEDLLLSQAPRVSPHGEIAGTVRTVPPVQADEALATAVVRLGGEPGLAFLSAVVRGRATGLLSRSAAEEWLRRPGAAPELASSDPVAAVTEDIPFDQRPEAATLEEVCEVIRRRPAGRKYEPIVVFGPAKTYRGLLTVDALVEEFSRLRPERALETSPVWRPRTRT